MSQDLGPCARGLPRATVFFPQGVDENDISWLFSILSDGTNMFNNFCILFLVYQSDGFVTMPAPLCDYLRPEDPISSPLLRTIKGRYFNRLSIHVDPGRPGLGATR